MNFILFKEEMSLWSTQNKMFALVNLHDRKNKQIFTNAVQFHTVIYIALNLGIHIFEVKWYQKRHHVKSFGLLMH